MGRLKKTISECATSKWGLAGISLVIPLFVISALSSGFDYDISNINKPILPVVALMMASGAIYLLVIFRLKVLVFSKSWAVWVIVIGLLARLSMFTSTPILEDDHYRYLWDGALTAHGLNPYAYSPKEVLQSVKHPDEPSDVPTELRELAAKSPITLSRINHSKLRTIYPPGAQGLFALAYWLTPFNITGWRAILLLLDIAAMVLLLILLRFEKISLSYVVIYWWNPLLIYETFCKCHFDLAVGVWLLLFIWALSRHKAILAAAMANWLQRAVRSARLICM